MDEFLKRGGAIKSCPTAAVAESSGAMSKADQQKLAEHQDERKAKITYSWGHRKERQLER